MFRAILFALFVGAMMFPSSYTRFSGVCTLLLLALSACGFRRAGTRPSHSAT
eukprot:m.296599 g.296599  ORF g.296599 m.296599 type:complete len:52 (+) comp13424_c0_seq1:1254-1409(+)